jgi:hypothetical protein
MSRVPYEQPIAHAVMAAVPKPLTWEHSEYDDTRGERAPVAHAVGSGLERKPRAAPLPALRLVKKRERSPERAALAESIEAQNAAVNVTVERRPRSRRRLS